MINVPHPYRRLKRNGRCIDEHRYMMELYLGRRLHRHELIHHKNGDPLDNRIDNLEIVSNKEHAMKHNWGKNNPNQHMVVSPIGSNASWAKLCESDIVNIRARVANGDVMRKIAREYCVHHSTIQALVYEESWKHVQMGG